MILMIIQSNLDKRTECYTTEISIKRKISQLQNPLKRKLLKVSLDKADKFRKIPLILLIKMQFFPLNYQVIRRLDITEKSFPPYRGFTVPAAAVFFAADFAILWQAKMPSGTPGSGPVRPGQFQRWRRVNPPNRTFVWWLLVRETSLQWAHPALRVLGKGRK